MDSELAKFAKFTEKDIQKACPRLSLNIKSRDEKVSPTLPSLVIFTLRREDDAIQEPVTFSWTSQGDRVPWASFILLQHTSSGLQEVEVQRSERHRPEDTLVQKVVVGKDDLRQLECGEEEKFWLTLPEQLHKVLHPGEEYTLYWPGAEVPIWQLGSIKGNQGKELTRDTERQNLIIPAGPHVSFEVQEESHAWPDRVGVEAERGFAEANSREESWRWKNMLLPRSEQPPKPRAPGAPMLSVRVKGPDHIAWQEYVETLKFTLTITYEGTSGNNHEDRPIVFHLSALTFHGKQLLRKTEMGWEIMYPEEGGMLFVDDPDVPVKVGEHQDFISLKPGESWSWEEDVGTDGFDMMPNDLKVGDVFRFTFRQAIVDWWHWGSKDDHAATVVELPCFIAGPVQKPKRNDGRPELVIPASNSVEVKVVSGE